MKDLHIVAHTHWDREWYKPFQVFRVKLVYMIDSLINLLEEDEDFTTFLLDGQVIMLEDYLKIRPEQQMRLKALTQAGRIVIGPWYIQPDEFAPDAESLIRNLQIGMRISSSFGRSMQVGYLPDSFGHSAQMPQILRSFGIDSAVVMRGVDFDKIQSTEFTWRGLNGDKVMGIYLLKGYMNAMFLSEDETGNTIRLKKLESELGRFTAANSILVMNGVDHAFAQPQVASFCKGKMGRRLGSLEEYIDGIKAIKSEFSILQGELVTPRHHRVHTSIASTRINQKAENRKLAISIERVLEPLCVMTSLFGAEYPQGLIHEAWKLLISNQTHDGICGCCTDEVHREMDQRFTEVRQMSESLIKNHSRAISCLFDREGLGILVFNTAMTTGTRYIEAEIFVNGAFVLENQQGFEVDTQILSIEDVDLSKNSIWTLYLGTPQPAKRVRIIFPCNFNSVLGCKYYRIIQTKSELRVPILDQKTLSKEIPCFQNDFYRMEIAPDGSLSILDKNSGRLYVGLNCYEDQGEGGDTYNHSPLKKDRRLLSTDFSTSIETIEDGQHRKRFRIINHMRVPRSLSADGDSRSSEETDMDITTFVSVYKQSQRIDFSVDINNQAKSHRIRALFPFGRKTASSFSETQFGVIERSTLAPVGGDDWPEIPLPIYSMQRFAGLYSDNETLAVLNRGLTEYEVYDPDDAVLAVTLHRGVSMMGRRNLAIRSGRASGVEVPTPDAESIGLLHREYSLFIGAKLENGALVSEADRYVSPTLAVQNRLNLEKIEKDNQDFFKFLSIENLTSLIAKSMDGVSHFECDLISLRKDSLSVSAVKKAEDNSSIIVRLFNPGSEAVRGECLILNFPHTGLSVVDLKEEDIGIVSGHMGEWILPEVGSCSQLTIKISREEKK